MALKKRDAELTSETEQKTIVQDSKAATVKGPVMYLGPTILKVGLKKNMLFKDGVPEEFNREPFKRLFAEPLEINALKANIKKAGSAANLAYKAVLEE